MNRRHAEFMSESMLGCPVNAFSDTCVSARMSCNDLWRGDLAKPKWFTYSSPLPSAWVPWHCPGGEQIWEQLQSYASQRFGAKPHEAQAVHMLQESDLILVGNIFPISVMLPIFAELMEIITLFFCGNRNPCRCRRRPSACSCWAMLWRQESPSSHGINPSLGYYPRTLS